MMNKTQLKAHHREITGGDLSNTSKMPSKSFNLSALHCGVGSKLAKVKGSVCDGCYALKGNYRRYKLIDQMIPKTVKINNPKWVDAITWLILNQDNKKDKNFFRWHDSGDVQSIEHLRKIALVCENTPNVKHWLPTREYKIVNAYLEKYGSFPLNLVVRLSAHMIDGKAPELKELNTSTVHKDKAPIGAVCDAPNRKGQCLDCRLCWMKEVKNISYKLH